MLYQLILAALLGAPAAPVPAVAPELWVPTAPAWSHSEVGLEAEEPVPDPPAPRPVAGLRLPIPARSMPRLASRALHRASPDDLLLLLCRRNE